MKFDGMPSYLVLIGFVGAVLIVGGMIGTATMPGEWYAALVKPPFNPPDWIFAPVWFVLYIIIGIAGWLVWRREPRGLALEVWGAQILLNWLWLPVFFSWQQPWLAALLILIILALAVTFIVLAINVDEFASWLLVPYAAWIAFSSVLNIYIAIMN